MSTLGLPVDRPDWPVSADAWIELDALAEQIHTDDVRDTARWLMVFVSSLADERERYTAAMVRHDYTAADEACAEMRDLTALAAACKDHLRSVGYGPSR